MSGRQWHWIGISVMTVVLAACEGPEGPAGPVGSRGNTGPMGARGPDGPIGQTGKTGPAGPSGQAGKAGSAGPPGKPGLLNAAACSYVRDDWQDDSGSGTALSTIDCGPSAFVLNGGCEVVHLTSPGSWAVSGSAPCSSFTHHGWDLFNDDGQLACGGGPLKNDNVAARRMWLCREEGSPPPKNSVSVLVRANAVCCPM